MYSSTVVQLHYDISAIEGSADSTTHDLRLALPVW